MMIYSVVCRHISKKIKKFNICNIFIEINYIMNILIKISNKKNQHNTQKPK